MISLGSLKVVEPEESEGQNDDGTTSVKIDYNKQVSKNVMFAIKV